MKQQRRVRRQPQPHPDAQHRWDRAYQLLAQWARAASEATGAPPAGGEGSRANTNRCAGLDPAPSPSTGH